MSCPHCGYSLQTACALYGAEAVVAERLMDVEGCLGPEQQEAIRKSLEAFGRTFPQLFFLVYLGPLPAPASPRQFAFWLLNHAAVPDLEALQPNERGLLLVVDPRGGTAVLTGGYFIENFVSPGELDTVLKAASRDFSRRDYPAAVQTITGGLAVLLRSKAREVARHPDRFQPPRTGLGPAVFPPLVRTGEVSVLPEAGPAAASLPEEAKEPVSPPATARRTVVRAPSAARRANSRRR